ncbi:MAG: hypothetical protein ACTSPI_16600 [Candidatus Heimdallarchaeaceae archaeon]
MSYKNHTELFKAFVNRPRPDHQRKIGRYWSSEIYAIKQGYDNGLPENFFKREPIDEMGCRKIIAGLMAEDMLSKIYETMGVKCEPQLKDTIQITDDIELVVKPDFVYPTHVVETKFTFKEVGNEIPERYKDQLECEYRLLKKPTYLGIFSVPYDLRLIKYKPSQRRWEGIKRTLIEFDKILKVLNK